MASPRKELETAPSSSPRRQSILDVASDLIASLREKQPSLSPTSSAVKDSTSPSVEGEQGASVDHDDVKNGESVPADRNDKRETETSASEMIRAKENVGDEEAGDASEDCDSEGVELESDVAISTDQIDPLILETEQPQPSDDIKKNSAMNEIDGGGAGTHPSMESDASGSYGAETGEIKAPPGDFDACSGQDSPRRSSFFAQAASSMMATLRERRSSVPSRDANAEEGSTQVTGGDGNDAARRSFGGDQHRNSAEEAATLDLQAATPVVPHEDASHSEIYVGEESDSAGEDSGFDDGDRSLDRRVVTRNTEHALALEQETSRHFSIPVQDSPDRTSERVDGKPTAFTTLAPIGEMSISAGDIPRANVSVNALKRVGAALREVLNFLPETMMKDTCLKQLNSPAATETALDLGILKELRELGGILRGKPVPRLSLQCYNAIRRVESSGEMLLMDQIMELGDARALEFCAQPPEEFKNYGVPSSMRRPEEIQVYRQTKLAELRASVASCTLSTLASAPGPELFALWALVHTSVSSKISAKIAQQVASEEHQPTRQKLRNKAGSLRFAGGEVVADLDAEDGGDEDTIDTSDADELANKIAQNGLVGLKGQLKLNRQQVDAVLQSLREQHRQLVGGWLALFIAKLPPLLRIEIVRDFFQIAGLFFDGLYDPVLEFFRQYHPPDWVWQMIRWLRNIYNVLALDASKLLRYISDSWSVVGTAIFLSSILLMHLMYLVVVIRFWWTMPRTADKVRHGHEATTWATYAIQNARTTKLTTVFITVVLTLYLPLTKLAFNVLVVTHDPNSADAKLVKFVTQYRDGPYWFFFPLEAILLLITFTLSLPVLLVWSIWKNRPSGSLENEDFTFDLDGEKVAFDDKVYTELVSSDPSQLGCPYRSLYAGFERNWSIYKVLQMVAKILMALIVVAAAKSFKTSGLMISISYFFVVVLSKYSQPFIDPFDDTMEFFSKFTALTTVVGATAIACVSQPENISSKAAADVNGFMVFVVVVHIVNMAVMVFVLALGMSGTRVIIKRLIGWLSFSDTCRGVEDGRACAIIPRWDIAKEAKHRVWQSFWRAMLLELAVPTDASDIGNPKRKFKLNKDDDDEQIKGTDRLATLEEAVVASGLKRVESHWCGAEHTYTTQLQQLAREVLEGVDVYWNNPLGARDGHLDSVTCFGKMYVVPYPFHCVVVYDDAQDEAIIRDDCNKNSVLKSHENLSKLLFLNLTPEIMKKRELRQKLRVLSETKTPIKFAFEQTERVFLWPRIIGKRKWKRFNVPVFLTPGFYKFKCKYKTGVIRVLSNGDKAGMMLRVSKSGAMQRVRKWMWGQKWLQLLHKWMHDAPAFQLIKKLFCKPSATQNDSASYEKKSSTRIMADGFNVTIKYKDGTGEVDIPGFGSIPVKGPRKVVVKADHIGLKPSMEESETLSIILKATEAVWEPGLKELREKYRKYRHQLIKKHEDENAALSDAFWYFVYHNPHLSRKKLELYLREHETNPLLQKLPDTHKDALDALYLRQEWVFLNPRQTCWYVFWDDVYARNSGMKKALKREHFDPLLPTAICYKPPMEEKELVSWLKQHDLVWTLTLFHWELISRLFHRKLIAILYDKMADYEKKVEEEREKNEEQNMRKEDQRLRKLMLRGLFQSMRKFGQS
ncbi:hypothetical protein PHYPSEUDO_012895 [Phytophthora pseudosyringae]|uniref:Uncharacterized protein n=1 Tax=Phytophthora pseudosyringae TaxID=221518 RepID=A0A8T1W3P5_9STRA|nr:hypothetical protein PHYPSEUDO_012895 [Phytophthora pseudosyringae]